jgi:hypothetical protein
MFTTLAHVFAVLRVGSHTRIAQAEYEFHIRESIVDSEGTIVLVTPGVAPISIECDASVEIGR